VVIITAPVEVPLDAANFTERATPVDKAVLILPVMLRIVAVVDAV
jgi:hypothetical protein